MNGNLVSSVEQLNETEIHDRNEIVGKAVKLKQ